MTTRSSLFLVLVVFTVGGMGCASFDSSNRASSKVRADSAPWPAVAMDQDRLERIFADQVDAIAGPSGALQTKVDGIPVYCISDPVHDRMRIVAPIARVTGLDPRLHEVLLRANFHSALDARYAISEDVVFAAFLHPISSLSPELLVSALEQVVTLVKNFGTTYSSSELVFPRPDSGASDDS
jgi:hypothetical protein